MKKYKEIQEKTRTQIAIVCDWCGRKNPGYDWTIRAYEINETIISHKTGSSYPEGGSGEIIEVDLCPNCFEKLIKYLKKQGVKVNKKKWAW